MAKERPAAKTHSLEAVFWRMMVVVEKVVRFFLNLSSRRSAASFGFGFLNTATALQNFNSGPGSAYQNISNFRQAALP